MNIKTLSIDWLQINLTGDIKPSNGFYINQLDYQTRQFKEVSEVYYRGEIIATLAAKPHSPILNPKMVLLKFDNHLLYKRFFPRFALKIIDSLDLSYKGITRLDIAIDFEKFDNGFLPGPFIRDFMISKYLKNGRGKFKTIGVQKFSNIFEYLRFGSSTTGKSIYLYNKSKEFREVKTKYYIEDFWKLNGINTNNDIWRLELSLKGNRNYVVSNDTGEIKHYDISAVLNTLNLKVLMYAGINDLFSFKINNGTKNKSRMKDLKLFNDICKSKKLLKLTNNTDVGRSEKIFIKKLFEYNNEMRGTNFQLSIASDELLKHYASEHRLNKFLTSL